MAAACPPVDPEAADRELRERARALVATWPPLPPEKRLQLAALLRPYVPVATEPDSGAGPVSPPTTSPRAGRVRRHSPTPTRTDVTPQ